MPAPAGILNVDKPLGITSHDVVSQVRRVAGTRRVGHGGTLDPLASGVLVVAVGVATRLLEYVVGQPKTYEAVVRLGQTSTTYDAEGALSPPDAALEPLGALDNELLERVLDGFRGSIEQIPPMFSAVKREGQPLYKLARQGIEVTREARAVTIYDLTLVSWQPPDLKLRVSCSAGTYVRSLAHDLGQALGTGGYLAALRRMAVGTFVVDEAVQLERLNPATFAESLLPPDHAVTHLPRLDIDADMARRLRAGQGIPFSAGERPGEQARAYAPAGDFVGIVTATGGYWKPRKIFNLEDSNNG
jgi:tRNA pseudouridine55 synthase